MINTKSYKLPEGYSLLQTTLKTPDFLKDPLAFIMGNMKKFNGTYSVKLGLKNAAILTQDPNFISYVLKDNQRNYQKDGFAVRRSVKYVGNGLVFSDGDYWRRQRRLIQPSFHRQKIRDLSANVLQTIQTNLDDFTLNEPTDIVPTVQKVIFKTLLKSLFDIPLAPETMDFFREGFIEIQDFLLQDINNPLRRLFYPFNGVEKKAVAKIEKIRRLFLDIIDERRASQESFSDILDMLLNSHYEDNGETMNDTQMIDELLIFISAGHETTANTLNWLLYLLAANPEVQDKIHHLVANRPIENTANDIYMQAVINEGMRLYPPTWSTQRGTINDDEFGEYKYPKDTVIIPFFYGLHRDEKLWQDAANFQPERFIEGDKLKKFKHFFPFGAGPRMCIGNHFAIMEMAYFVGAFLKKYRIKTTGQIPKTQTFLTMGPDKVELLVEKRD